MVLQHLFERFISCCFPMLANHIRYDAVEEGIGSHDLFLREFSLVTPYFLHPLFLCFFLLFG